MQINCVFSLLMDKVQEMRKGKQDIQRKEMRHMARRIDRKRKDGKQS